MIQLASSTRANELASPISTTSGVNAILADCDRWWCESRETAIPAEKRAVRIAAKTSSRHPARNPLGPFKIFMPRRSPESREVGGASGRGDETSGSDILENLWRRPLSAVLVRQQTPRSLRITQTNMQAGAGLRVRKLRKNYRREPEAGSSTWAISTLLRP